MSQGRREDVLDVLLDNHEDDELDVELNKSDKKSRNFKMLKLAPKDVDQRGGRYKNNSNGNGNKRSRSESTCSEYSTHSGSCSCENHSSAESKDHSDAASQGSYQSFTRSPSLKIKINANSNSRTVKNLRSPPRNDEIERKRKRYDDMDAKPRKKSSSKRRDYDSLLKYFFKDSCYFVMKSNNPENIHICKREGVWATPLANEMKLSSAFKEFRNVILIFSVKESGKFQGFARLSSEANYNCEPVNWVLPPGINSCPFGGLFFIDWICRNELSFTKTTHLFNPFNEGKPVKIARDGQEIDPRVGEELCRLFPSDDSVDLIPLLKRMKKQTQNRPKKRHTRGPFMDYDRSQSSRGDYGRVRSYSSSEIPPIRKRLGSNGIMPRVHSSRHIRDDRVNPDRLRLPSRRDDSLNGGHYRAPSGNSYDHYHDSHDSYRRIQPRHTNSSYGRFDRRPPRDDRRY